MTAVQLKKKTRILHRKAFFWSVIFTGSASLIVGSLKLHWNWVLKGLRGPKRAHFQMDKEEVPR
jgi:hypothetical protein